MVSECDIIRRVTNFCKALILRKIAQFRQISYGRLARIAEALGQSENTGALRYSSSHEKSHIDQWLLT